MAYFLKSAFVLSTSVLLLTGCNDSSSSTSATAEDSTARTSTTATAEAEWIPLFDGTSLAGWKVNEHPATFTVEDGSIVAHGERAHLFYDGPVMDHTFKNFELKAEVMTTPGSNSGVYFHTQYQDEGWPSNGYEVQVNNSHPDPRRTASLYAIDDVAEPASPDNQWFTLYIKVDGTHIVTEVDGKPMVDYTQPDSVDTTTGRGLAQGTFALQGHDPESKVYFRSVMVRPLP
ncbi:protein of unknown function [Catalinimonas alkaloidigena]|uniref:3-keto-alpha-glucoside-1,2-lyase/3-keto-2-hydroxy-glucal hydratase domain-containing protein n=1 Tax=Catalinimonas alkaloidigena TaxID=1075417 RepID=A0A1G9PBU9_9BACT|nr:DUF1080 domain-containing protein [Catalinimonas alkaloidigena]SDL96194.1 protein of unknown function [Catalinimonas alkaloidigena]